MSGINEKTEKIMMIAYAGIILGYGILLYTHWKKKTTTKA